jgi:hypothetical protein
MNYKLIAAHILPLTVLAAVLGCGPVFAQQGTPQERAACGTDYRRFCRHTQPGLDAGSCLQAHRTRLHAACRGVLRSHGM